MPSAVNISLIALSPRYAAPVPIDRQAAICTQPADASPYDVIASTSSDSSGSSSEPPSSWGTHILNMPSRWNASTTVGSQFALVVGVLGVGVDERQQCLGPIGEWRARLQM